MARHFGLVVTDQARTVLAALLRSPDRGEADRARAILWTLDGQGSRMIAGTLGVRADRVRKWRSAFRAGGAEALRSRPHTGRPGHRGAAVLACARAILAEPSRAVWTLPRLKAEIGRRAGLTISPSRLSTLLRQGGFAWRRPRHSLKGRQDAQAVQRSGLRLRLLRQQARAGDIRLLFGDEFEALTLPFLAHAWAKRGADLRVEAPGQARRRALLGALDAATGHLIVATSASKRSADFIGLLERLDRELAPPAGALGKPTVLVLDNGPIHTSRATAKALAARPWLTIEWLPKYAPELNDIERSWRDLKRHHLAHQTFTSVDYLDTQIHHAVAAMNHERMPSPCPKLRMAA